MTVLIKVNRQNIKIQLMQPWPFKVLDLINKIQGIYLPPNIKLISVDVVNSFTRDLLSN